MSGEVAAGTVFAKLPKTAEKSTHSGQEGAVNRAIRYHAKKA